MRTRAASMCAAAFLLGGAILVSASAYRLASAEDVARLAENERRDALSQEAELLSLRSRRERVSQRARPQQDVIALMNGVLAEAGIPSDRLKSLENDSNDAVSPAQGGAASARYRRQSVAVHLEQLTCDQIGKLLGKLRKRQSVWTATRLELTHVREQSEPALLYNLGIVISAMYLSDDALGRPK